MTLEVYQYLGALIGAIAPQVSQQEMLSNSVTNVPQLDRDGNVDDSDLERILNEVPLAGYSTADCGKQSVNLTMVREGQAVVYPEYLDNCADTRQEYLDAEAQAKAQKLGFWNQPNPVMPWDFRRGGQSNNQPSANASPSPSIPATSEPGASQQEQSNNCDPAYPDVCIPPSPPDLDCGDISHRNFQVLAPDPHRFDGRDKDGIGCES